MICVLPHPITIDRATGVQVGAHPPPE